MVKSFEPGRGQAAFWASPRLVIYLDFSGLDTAYENEGAPPLEPARDRKMFLSSCLPYIKIGYRRRFIKI